ncbi:MAG: hypothetical protein LBC55_08670 [Desulfovibrio sp.]|nr:hypothetical protein [Desulfovibrio sp.]
MPTTPYLSIVTASRNDSHGGNIRERTQSFLDSLAEQCARHRLPAELVMVDWNPPADRPSLREILDTPPASPYFTTRFITVPHEVHASLAHADILPFFQMIAKNVGIRRARGKFILATNIDILFSEELMAFLAEQTLQERYFYRADRHDLDVFAVPPKLFGDGLMTFCRSHVSEVQGHYGTYASGMQSPAGDPADLHTNACGDFTLMSRRDWEQTGGYPEYALYSIYIDGLGLYRAAAAGIRQTVLPYPLCIYHINHSGGWVLDKALCESKPSLSYDEYQALGLSILRKRKPPARNNDKWGYNGEIFFESSFASPCRQREREKHTMGDACIEKNGVPHATC